MAETGWDFTEDRRSPSGGPAAAVPALLLGAREAARALGISERTLWTLTKEARVPHVRIGRRVLYDPDDLWAWIATLKKPRESPSQGRNPPVGS